jgi:hypothetical protein
MASLLRVCLILLVSTAAFAQAPQPAQPQMPPGFDRVEFFGVVLARMSFCGMFHHVDQYEMAMAMKAFGVVQTDRPAMEASRDRNYQILRDKFKTAREHADFCIENRSWPFFIKAGRKGSVPHQAFRDFGSRRIWLRGSDGRSVFWVAGVVTVIIAGNHFGQSGGQNAVARVGIERLKYRMA